MSTPGQDPDGQPDSPPASGGHVRMPPDIGESPHCGPLPTSADTVRTGPDGYPADSGTGVRFAYRASVPRHLVGVAFAEAFGLLGQELYPAPEAPDDHDQAPAPPHTG
ncbi:hypothetical protein ACFY0N_00730 [Streptomyces vinaceus]|uniref:hypothetical protein n=1 Tax=Streptomyces vinaceus TaxID=1960 RepID=UPI0036AA070A